MRPVRSPETNRLRALPEMAHSPADGRMTTIIVIATRAPPTSAGLSGDRKVVMAPSAKIQAFGLMAWNAAAWRTDIGRATAPRWSARAPAICQARYSRYADPA